MRVQVAVSAVVKAFKTTDNCDHRQRGFDDHALVPSTFRTKFEVFGQAVFVMKTQVSQNDGLPLKRLNHFGSDSPKLASLMR